MAITGYAGFCPLDLDSAQHQSARPDRTSPVPEGMPVHRNLKTLGQFAQREARQMPRHPDFVAETSEYLQKQPLFEKPLVCDSWPVFSDAVIREFANPPFLWYSYDSTGVIWRGILVSRRI